MNSNDGNWAEDRAPLTRRAFMVGAIGAGSLLLANGSERQLNTPQVSTTDAAVAGTSDIADSSSFIDAIGVNTHWSYTDTPYSTSYRTAVSRLQELGIKHVRGDAAKAVDLWDKGIKTTVLVDKNVSGSGDPASQFEQFASLVTSGAIAAVESTNEPDLFWTRSNWSYGGQPFPAGALLWQRDLWNAVKANPQTQHLPVIGTALGQTYWGSANPFNPASQETTCDYGNMHPYPRGNPFTQPRPYGGVSRYYWDTDFPSSTLDVFPINFQTYRPPFGSRPMMATESGYSTWRLGPSEIVQGRYIPRILLENFRLGIVRTYLYELIDEFRDSARSNIEANFGLLRNDMSPKPAFQALKNLIALSEPTDGTVGTSQDLSVRLQATAPNGYDARYVHHLPLRRGARDYVIFVWHEVSSDDCSPLSLNPPQPPRKLVHPAIPTSITFSRPPKSVAVRHFTDTGTVKPQIFEWDEDIQLGFDANERITAILVKMP